MPEIFVFSKKVWDTLDPVDQQLIRKASALVVEKERQLWTEMEQASLEQLKSQGAEIIVDVDKQPFIEATQAVRDKFGEKYGDLIKQIEAFAPKS